METAWWIRRLIKKELIILGITSIYLVGQLILNIRFVILNYLEINHLPNAFNGFLAACFSSLIVIAMCVHHIKYWILNYRFRKFVKNSKEERITVNESLIYIEKGSVINKHIIRHVYILLLSHLIYTFLVI